MKLIIVLVHNLFTRLPFSSSDKVDQFTIHLFHKPSSPALFAYRYFLAHSFTPKGGIQRPLEWLRANKTALHKKSAEVLSALKVTELFYYNWTEILFPARPRHFSPWAGESNADGQIFLVRGNPNIRSVTKRVWTLVTPAPWSPSTENKTLGVGDSGLSATLRQQFQKVIVGFLCIDLSPHHYSIVCCVSFSFFFSHTFSNLCILCCKDLSSCLWRRLACSWKKHHADKIPC